MRTSHLMFAVISISNNLPVKSPGPCDKVRQVTEAFDAVLAGRGVEVVKIPPRSPPDADRPAAVVERDT